MCKSKGHTVYQEKKNYLEKIDKKKCPAELVKDSKDNRTGPSAGLKGKVIDGHGESSSSEMAGQRFE